MSMSVRGMGAAAVASLALVGTATAFGGRTRIVTMYYYPATPVWTPGIPIAMPQPQPLFLPPNWPVCAPAPALAPQGPNYARPTPAPPSQTPMTREPPLAPPVVPGTAPSSQPPPLTPPVVPMRPAEPATPGAAVAESRPYFDLYPVDPRGADKPQADRCSIGFWNVTDRELAIKVDGQPRTVPRGKSLTLELGRQFTWQVDGREAQIQRVAPENSGLDIVIRQ